MHKKKENNKQFIYILWLALKAVVRFWSTKLNHEVYEQLLNGWSLNTLLNKSWAWHIDGATNKKNPFNFYKILTLKWHVSKFEPNRIIGLQISYLSEATEFRVLTKHCFLIGKKSVKAKQWLDKCYSNSASSETTVKGWYADFKRSRTDTNDTEHSRRLNSAVTPENTPKNPQTRFGRS